MGKESIKKDAEKLGKKENQIKIIGIKAPLIEGQEYIKKESSAKVLIDAGCAKKAK